MSRKSWAVLLATGTIVLSSCTKEKEVPKSADGKPMVSRQADPERVVFETELDVPKDLVSKVKKTDLIIWNLMSETGDVLVARIAPVPAFPAKITVQAKQLFQPIPEGAHLVFSARIVKFGDESKPPQKGQLTAYVGSEPDEHEVVENKAVNQKLMDKFMKKLKISGTDTAEVTIGTKSRAEFAPSLM